MEQQDVDQLRQSWVTETQKSLDPNAPQLPTASQAPEKFTVNMGGQAYTYENKAQYEQALSEWNTNIQAKLRAQQEEVERYKAEMARFQQQQQGQSNNSQDYDNEAFFTRMAKDGREGLEYGLQTLILGKYDPNIKIGQVIATAASAGLKTSQDMTRLQLERDNPHVQWHDPNTAKMIETARQQFGQPATKDGYENTLGRLTMNGFLKSRKEWQQEVINASNPNYGAPVGGNVTEIRRSQGMPSAGYSTSNVPVNEQAEAQKIIDDFTNFMTDPKISDEVKTEKARQYREYLTRLAG